MKCYNMQTRMWIWFHAAPHTERPFCCGNSVPGLCIAILALFIVSDNFLNSVVGFVFFSPYVELVYGEFGRFNGLHVHTFWGF